MRDTIELQIARCILGGGRTVLPFRLKAASTLLNSKLGQTLSRRVWVYTVAASLAGGFLYSLTPKAGQKAGEGHRSLSGEGDNCGQKIYTDIILEHRPGTVIYAEEPSEYVVDKDNPEQLLTAKEACVIDPVDSTASFTQELGTFSTAVGGLDSLVPTSSVLYAPNLNGGFAVVSEGKQVFVVDGSKDRCEPVQCKPVPTKASVLLLGVDTLMFTNVTTLLPLIVPSFRCVLTAPSGLLGLAFLAAGRAHVALQTPQAGQDWGALHHAVTAQGYEFFWYRIENGSKVRVKNFGLDAFRFRPKHHRLGYVAGPPDLAEKLYNALPEEGWEPIDPNTVSGSW